MPDDNEKISVKPTKKNETEGLTVRWIAGTRRKSSDILVSLSIKCIVSPKWLHRLRLRLEMGRSEPLSSIGDENPLSPSSLPPIEYRASSIEEV